MAADRTLRDDPAMNEVLASIRRIVREEEARAAEASAAPPGAQGDVLELTEAMRVDRAGAPPPVADPGPAVRTPAAAAPAPEPPRSPTPPKPAAEAPPVLPAADAEAAPMRDADGLEHALDDLGLDEAAVAEIARAVLREELDGALGERISARLRDLVREEIARVVEELAEDG